MWRVRTLCQVLVDVPRECENPEIVILCVRCWLMYWENVKILRVILCVRCWLMCRENVKIPRLWFLVCQVLVDVLRECESPEIAIFLWCLFSTGLLDIVSSLMSGHVALHMDQTTIVTVGSCQEVYSLILDGVVLSLVVFSHKLRRQASHANERWLLCTPSTTTVCVVWLDWSALRHCTQVENDEVQCCTEGKE